MLSSAQLMDRLAYRAPQIFFFGLFPFYFAYHAASGAGLVPLFLPGGGWSVWIFPGALVLGTLALVTRRRAGHTWFHAPVAFLACWVGAYALSYFVFGAEWQRNPVLLRESIKLVAGWACLYLIGYLLPLRPEFVRCCLYALLAMAVCVFFLKPEQLFDGPATYQGYATSIVFVAMLCLAAVRTELQPVVLAVTFCALPVLTSRADLAGFVFVAAAWVVATVISTGSAAQKVKLIFAGAAASAAGLLIAALLIGLIPNPVRIVAMPAVPRPAPPSSQPDFSTTAAFRNRELLDVTGSQTASKRTELMHKGLEDIKASPVTGIYGGQMRNGGTHGSYIHNALSAWSQFGLLPFLVYVALCLASPIGALLLPNKHSPEWRFTLFVGVFTLVLGATLKSVFWAMPALAWGLLAARLESSVTQSCLERGAES